MIQATAIASCEAPWQMAAHHRAVWRDLEPEFIAQAIRSSLRAVGTVLVGRHMLAQSEEWL